MSRIAVFDTSVLVDQARSNKHAKRIAELKCVVRHSTVVLAELRRGASSAADRRMIAALERSQPLLTPTEKVWLESGDVLAAMRAELGLEARKLRELHFDVLIALTARAYGAQVITSNRADFELIRRYREFAVEVW